ncbi:YihY family inner membrane protein [Pseudoduganella sp. SL102]|uniref:YihY family inner membrane protein n=1 Tax=Pseudoduganella sp. SL102 TaxID=2995154 RepID=UPI00248B4C27|nr:YihY family inner membrane protein [Pseudoduganella sp. SL102]WBR99946.1 YihY family inner membrane protein [Pseudoduganella sp. SL102]
MKQRINTLYRFVVNRCGDGVAELRSLSWAEVRDLGLFARRRLREESLPQVAGGLTFTTVFALVPVLTIALAIFTTFPMFMAFRTALEAYFIQSVMPKAISETILSYLTTFAAQATGLSAIGAVTLVATSAAMMGMIERVFNRIWGVKAERRWTRRLLVYWALITLGPLLVGVSISLSTDVFSATSSLVGNVAGALAYSVLSLVLATAGFTFLYMVVPNKAVDWRDALAGGVLAGLAFELAKRGFAVFITEFPTYSKIYGALAALPLFLLWVYLSWLITLLGALLAAALPVIKYERWWYEPVPGGAFVDALAVLKVLHGASRYGDTALVSSGAIRARTRMGFDELHTLLDQMQDKGWVGRVRVEPAPRMQFGKRVDDTGDNWVLLANPEVLTLAEVYRLFVFGGMPVNAGVAQESSDPRDVAARRDAARLARHVEDAVEAGLGLSLADHFGPAVDRAAVPLVQDGHG